MLLTYRYRLYPTEEQKKQIHVFCGAQRWLWNWLISYNVKRKENRQTTLSYPEMCERIVLLKGQHTWLKDCPSQSLQQVAREVDQEMRGEIWTYRKKKDQRGCFSVPQHVRDKNGSVIIPKLGSVKWKKHRPFPSKIKVTNVVWEGERYFLVVKSQIEPKKKKIDIPIEQAIGIAIGEDFLTADSNGLKFTVPKSIHRQKRRLKIRERSYSRKQNGSNGRRSREEVKTTQNHIMDKQHDLFHKHARFYLRDKDLICIENSSRTKEGAMLVRIIEQKAERHGKHLVEIKRFDPAHLTCNICRSKTILDNHCTNCGSTDPMINAAKNILTWGYKQYRRGGGN